MGVGISFELVGKKPLKKRGPSRNILKLIDGKKKRPKDNQTTYIKLW